MEKLLQQLADIDAKIDAILKKDELSDADREEIKKLEADRSKLEERIDFQKKADARTAQRHQLQADQTIARTQAERDSRTTAGNRRLAEPDLGQPNHTAALPRVPAEVRVHDPRAGFTTPRDFLMAVMLWNQGMRRDPRLEARFSSAQLAVGSDEHRTSSDPAGGFLIPEAFHPNVMRVDPEADPMAGRVTTMPMNLPTLKIPCRVDKNHSTSVSGGFTVTRRPETVAGTPSQQQYERLNFTAHELFGLTYATEEILTDSPQSFIAIIEAGFTDQFTGHTINERLNGTGVGEFLGVNNSPCLVTVNKEVGQSANTIVKENIDKMRARCWKYGRSIWLANHDTLPMLKSLAQVVGIGGAPVPYLTVDADGNAILDGRPCFFTEYTKTLGTAGDLLLGVWSEFLEGTYQPMQSAESMHVRFVNHERAFKFWTRNAGMPWWSSPLTPKNSASTLSPFVVLETRS